MPTILAEVRGKGVNSNLREVEGVRKGFLELGPLSQIPKDEGRQSN